MHTEMHSIGMQLVVFAQRLQKKIVGFLSYHHFHEFELGPKNVGPKQCFIASEEDQIRQGFSDQELVMFGKDAGKYYVVPNKPWQQSVAEAEELTGYTYTNNGGGLFFSCDKPCKPRSAKREGRLRAKKDITTVSISVCGVKLTQEKI